jgi:hypothetical protein
MNKKKMILNLSLLLVLFQSCSNENNESSLPTTITTITNVYAAGSESNGTNLIAKIWKDGIPTLLSYSNIGDESASSIFVFNDDIYATGYNTQNFISHAKVWKNGNEILLQDNQNSYANAIFV